uniref:WGS project CAEQ00000000 data, annotated contig 1670 n=1 Tax=Trypanosoma congolense (strain IL3000) TaxID=1068625 RepID=F9W7X2_TRYCI|nr:unnamed protein product [Trypanosoma congolense IL3000]
MLRECWLLSDFDGTLVSTPHKAQGAYVSLAKSPCYDQVKRWLLNGGNLCVITTANSRVVDQLYSPLCSVLNNECSDSMSPGVRGSQREGDNEGVSRGVSNDAGRRCGQLLLSLNTGAVLYNCKLHDISFVPGYVDGLHPATEESINVAKSTGAPMEEVLTQDVNASGETITIKVGCVRGTCIQRELRALVHGLEDFYQLLTIDLICGQKRAGLAFEKLSARYKTVWKLLFKYIDLRCAGDAGVAASPAAGVVPGVEVVGEKRPMDNVAWKCNFVRKYKQMFLMLGFIRIEEAEEKIIPSEKEGNVGDPVGEARDEATNKEEIRNYTYALFDDDSALACDIIARIMYLLGAEIPKGFVRNGDFLQHYNSAPQVLALGVPIDLSTLCLKRKEQLFASIKVSAIPQPNSISFSKLGVCKSTAVRYLTDTRLKAERTGLRGVVNVAQAVALGDNPHTADYELTANPLLKFISFEKADQRKQRHAKIDDRRRNCVDSGSNGATSQARGALMDDRRVKNIHYVGGEEAGAAAFLRSLMDILAVPPAPGPGERPQGCPGVVDPTTFTEAVVQAARSSANSMNQMSHL